MKSLVSVVIPTHRRPQKLVRCLEALAATEYPLDRLEVIVVEDGGPAPELDAVRSRTFGSLRVVWLSQPHAGPAAARNLGARHARHALLAFTDDDCRPRPGWIGQLVAALEQDTQAVVGGHTVNVLMANACSEASQALVSYITAYGLQRGDPFFASNNIALSRQDFARLGGFDESFPLAGGEDRDFCDRCVRLGLRFLHRPEALVDHEHDLSLKGFWRQHFRYGHGAWRYHCLRTSRRGSTILQDTGRMLRSMDLRFYVDLIRFPFSQGANSLPWRVTALLALSQIPNALGFFHGWAQATWRAARHPQHGRGRGGSPCS